MMMMVEMMIFSVIMMRMVILMVFIAKMMI